MKRTECVVGVRGGGRGGGKRKEHCTLGGRWIRHRAAWRKKLTFRINGECGSWVEECVDVNNSWGLECKVCRWAGESSKFARGEIRCRRATALYQLMHHGNHTKTTTRNLPNRGHARALLKFERKAEQPYALETPETPGVLTSGSASVMPRFGAAAEPNQNRGKTEVDKR